ncbi:hypothetical protein ACH5RR_026401 [Cinchona calisaya]|uniref:Uncharacterized protein n=1 Tax=Cinchona calisaya TaxID=153742 RepID=A0ABD2Z4L1_9GENT
MLLKSYEDETIRRIAIGAVANLEINGKDLLLVTDLYPIFSKFNQELIMAQSGIGLLAMTASDVEVIWLDVDEGENPDLCD